MMGPFAADVFSWILKAAVLRRVARALDSSGSLDPQNYQRLRRNGDLQLSRAQSCS